MRFESSVTSISWIPSELVTGLPKLAFTAGINEYDEPLADRIGDLEDWRHAGKFRFASALRVWAETDDSGKFLDAGHTGRSYIGRTKVNIGRKLMFAAIAMPDIQGPPEFGDGFVRFTQTSGGRAPLPAPRIVNGRPHLAAPVIWTTLQLTLWSDGRQEFELTGASPFPRHWVYGPDGKLAAKAGLTDFESWFNKTIDASSPWGGENAPALMTEAETELERRLATDIMRGGSPPEIRTLEAGETLCRQGEKATDVYLLLDGVLTVNIDGKVESEIGPGAILGERAGLEDGLRTATLSAKTPVRVATAHEGSIDINDLSEVAQQHRREDR